MTPRFAWCAALIVPLLALWSLATPLMASVDEPAHVIWAAAAVRGEWRQPLVTTSIGQESEVTVPGGIARLDGIANCLPVDPDATADCVSTVAAQPSGSTTSMTQFGRYPLPYYLAVGWPTLLLKATAAAYAARLVSAVLVGLVLALSLWLLWKYHPRRSTILGWAVAATPAVLASVVW